MSVSAISPVSSAAPGAVYAFNPATAAPAAATSLDGDAGALVQEYGAVALATSYLALPPIYTAQVRVAVPPVAPVLGPDFRHIDTYA